MKVPVPISFSTFFDFACPVFSTYTERVYGGYLGVGGVLLKFQICRSQREILKCTSLESLLSGPAS